MLLDEFWLGFWGYWHCEKFVLQAYMNLFMMHVGNFVGMCKFYFLNMTIFVGKFVSMENFCGHRKNFMGMKLWLWKNFVGYVIFDNGKFCG